MGVLSPLRKKANPLLERLNNRMGEMIGAMEKGVEAARLTAPPQGVYEHINLKDMTKFISYKAAKLRETVTLKYVLAIVVGLLCIEFTVSRIEILGLQQMLREKEYILAPGVSDFTPASAHAVSDSYVEQATTYFIGLLGNVSTNNVESRFEQLSEFMEAKLKARFDMEVSSWVNTMKAEGVTEVFDYDPSNLEVIADGKGFYKATVVGRRERWSSGEYLGHTDEVIELVMQLVPPAQGKQWFLQINELSRSEASSFRWRGRGSNGRLNQ